MQLQELIRHLLQVNGAVIVGHVFKTLVSLEISVFIHELGFVVVLVVLRQP